MCLIKSAILVWFELLASGSAASQPSRTAGGDFSHTNSTATRTYIRIHLITFIQCTRDRYRRKMRLASESAEEEETRLSRRGGRDRARHAAQSSQATKNCRGSETAEAREPRDRDRRKMRLDSESAEEKETRNDIAYTNSV